MPQHQLAAGRLMGSVAADLCFTKILTRSSIIGEIKLTSDQHPQDPRRAELHSLDQQASQALQIISTDSSEVCQSSPRQLMLWRVTIKTRIPRFGLRGAHHRIYVYLASFPSMDLCTYVTRKPITTQPQPTDPVATRRPLSTTPMLV